MAEQFLDKEESVRNLLFSMQQQRELGSAAAAAAGARPPAHLGAHMGMHGVGAGVRPPQQPYGMPPARFPPFAGNPYAGMTMGGAPRPPAPAAAAAPTKEQQRIMVETKFRETALLYQNLLKRAENLPNSPFAPTVVHQQIQLLEDHKIDVREFAFRVTKELGLREADFPLAKLEEIMKIFWSFRQKLPNLSLLPKAPKEPESSAPSTPLERSPAPVHRPVAVPSQPVARPSVDRSTPFLASDHLIPLIRQILNVHFDDAPTIVEGDVLNLLSAAAEAAAREVIVALGALAAHRGDASRSDPRCQITSRPKKQLEVFGKIDEQLKRRDEQRQRDQLRKEAKTDEDARRRLKERMEKEDAAESHKKANQTANAMLDQIGGGRKRKKAVGESPAGKRGRGGRSSEMDLATAALVPAPQFKPGYGLMIYIKQEPGVTPPVPLAKKEMPFLNNRIRRAELRRAVAAGIGPGSASASGTTTPTAGLASSSVAGAGAATLPSTSSSSSAAAASSSHPPIPSLTLTQAGGSTTVSRRLRSGDRVRLSDLELFLESNPRWCMSKHLDLTREKMG